MSPHPSDRVALDCTYRFPSRARKLVRLVPGQRRQQLSFGLLLQPRSLLARVTARRRQHRQPGASIVGGWFPCDEAIRLEAIDQLRDIRFTQERRSAGGFEPRCGYSMVLDAEGVTGLPVTP